MCFNYKVTAGCSIGERGPFFPGALTLSGWTEYVWDVVCSHFLLYVCQQYVDGSTSWCQSAIMMDNPSLCLSKALCLPPHSDLTGGIPLSSFAEKSLPRQNQHIWETIGCMTGYRKCISDKKAKYSTASAHCPCSTMCCSSKKKNREKLSSMKFNSILLWNGDVQKLQFQLWETSVSIFQTCIFRAGREYSLSSFE